MTKKEFSTTDVMAVALMKAGLIDGVTEQHVAASTLRSLEFETAIVVRELQLNAVRAADYDKAFHQAFGRKEHRR